MRGKRLRIRRPTQTGVGNWERRVSGAVDDVAAVIVVGEEEGRHEAHVKNSLALSLCTEAPQGSLFVNPLRAGESAFI
jgi:hypothetical protein